MESETAGQLALYPAQQEGVERYLNSTSARMLLIYGTGCGKTATAIRAIYARWMRDPCKLRPAPRILVVCPAIVRRHWCREFQRWAGVEAWPIEMSRNVKHGTKRAKFVRDQAYLSSVQVVSYDLISQVDAQPWDYIILDEIHHLGEPTSKQSKRVRVVLEANSNAGVLGLSATPIPTTLKQMWNPLRLLFGTKEWGPPSRTGNVSWDFADRYCGIIRNDYGCAIGPGRQENIPELKARIAAVSHQLTRDDIAADMPRLVVRLLETAGKPTVQAEKRLLVEQDPYLDVACQYVKGMSEDIHHVVILVYHREKATAIAEAVKRLVGSDTLVVSINGSMPPGKRDDMLSTCAAHSRCILVATTESLREGIRMMWAQQVLFAEWRQSPAQVVQVLGRFQSVGDLRKPIIDVFVDESMVTEAHQLIQRVDVINSCLHTGEAEEKIRQVFEPKGLSEERMTELTLDLFNDLDSHQQRSNFDDDETEDDDDD